MPRIVIHDPWTVIVIQEREGSPPRKVATKSVADPASTLLEIVTEEGLTRAKSLTPPRHEASTVLQVYPSLIHRFAHWVAAIVLGQEALMRCGVLGRLASFQVRGLTRPFTLLQLHALLGAYGGYSREADFWIDGIKSHCLVRFPSADDARAARDGLHNVRWPPGNPKILRADFATEEKVRCPSVLSWH